MSVEKKQNQNAYLSTNNTQFVYGQTKNRIGIIVKYRNTSYNSTMAVLTLHDSTLHVMIVHRTSVSQSAPWKVYWRQSMTTMRWLVPRRYSPLSWSANRCTTNKEVYLAKGATSRYDMWVTCTLLMSGIYMDRWHSWSTDSYTADDGVYLDKRASRRRNLALICCKYKNWVLALKKDNRLL